MLPWGHAAVGYLLYAAHVRYHNGDHPSGWPVLALAVGTQFADLVDKPLGWYLGVVPSGRSLGHSIITAVVVLAVVYWLAVQYDRRDLGVAFAIGHVSHLAADALYPALRGDWSDLGFLLWPVVGQPDADADRAVVEVLLNSTFSTTGYFELGLFVVATALWIRHGMPGLRELYVAVRTAVRRLTP